MDQSTNGSAGILSNPIRRLTKNDRELIRSGLTGPALDEAREALNDCSHRAKVMNVLRSKIDGGNMELPDDGLPVPASYGFRYPEEQDTFIPGVLDDRVADQIATIMRLFCAILLKSRKTKQTLMVLMMAAGIDVTLTDEKLGAMFGVSKGAINNQVRKLQKQHGLKARVRRTDEARATMSLTNKRQTKYT